MKLEPGTNEEILELVQRKYGVEFPMFSKIDVNGKNAHPLFKYLRAKSELYNPKKKTTKEIPWNFAKFMLTQEGEVQMYLDPRQVPAKALLVIEEALNK